eukprot:878101-Prymnesium_polylepis.1
MYRAHLTPRIASAPQAPPDAPPPLPKLLVFDLDACLWSPEMYELGAAPTAYDASLGGVKAGHDTVKLFPGAAAVMQLLLDDK